MLKIVRKVILKCYLLILIFLPVINVNAQEDDLNNVLVFDSYNKIKKMSLIFSGYNNYTIIFSVFFILLTTVIVLLLINIHKNRKIQNELSNKHLELTNLYAQLATSKEELKAKSRELIINQKQLESVQIRYRLVAESANDIIWDWDLISNKKTLADKAYALLGYEKDSLCTMEDWYNIVHPEDLPKVKHATHDYLCNNTSSYTCEYRVRKNDNSYMWILSNGKAIKNEENKYYKMSGSYTDITKIKDDQSKIEFLAYNDSLSGLPNRVQIKKYAETEIKQCKQNEKIAFFFIDLDNFKVINNSFGHIYGDMVLKGTAMRFKTICGIETQVARHGGDEFVIIKKVSSYKELNDFIDKLNILFKKPLDIDDKKVYISASMGYALYPEDGNNYDNLLVKANEAMYKVKENGKSHISHFIDNMNSDSRLKIKYHNSLHKAIEDKELYLTFQPQINVENKTVEGFEALIRWNSKDYGLIPPDVFIPIAELNGLIIPIGYWVIKKSFEFSKKINKEFNKKFSISINISVIQLQQEDFPQRVEALLKEMDIDPSNIYFEVTESVYARSFEHINKQLNRIRDFGIQIALDDFGTGYSSLTYLRKLPISIIKIDKSFIDDILSNQEARLLSTVIIKMGHKLNLKIVAEGVETEEQLVYLKQKKCHTFQGYLVNPPLDEEAALDFLRNQIV